MITTIIIIIHYYSTYELPSLMTVVGTSCADIVMAISYISFFGIAVGRYYTCKREYIEEVLAIKREKKSDKGTAPIS